MAGHQALGEKQGNADMSESSKSSPKMQCTEHWSQTRLQVAAGRQQLLLTLRALSPLLLPTRMLVVMLPIAQHNNIKASLTLLFEPVRLQLKVLMPMVAIAIV